jgi:hypothetical protein
VGNCMRKQLIFVYNANENLFSQVTDYVHKILSPKTYACNLCSLTHSNFGIRKEWKAFIETLDAELVFLHKDEFCKEYPSLQSSRFPAIFQKTDQDEIEVFIDQKEIDEIKGLDLLKNLILERFSN